MISHVSIEAPVGEVFERLVKPDYRVLWIQNAFNIRYDGNAPCTAPGAAFVQVQKDGGNTIRFRGVNLNVEEPNMFRYRLMDRMFVIDTTYRLLTHHSGTLVQMSAELRGKNPVSQIIGRWTAGVRQRLASEELSALKRLCEGA
ncbi:hypothetical protein GE107_12440 [Cohnella sp. CFH 77786]|uniref:SRPBCC family protein n=1 Tax=Cohnella sp. CFH 77786 TaxID=2662265 RepID=UPI001C610002|nr:SRPBCC family protein [Cohnella sp. CFH 77786]MBW5446870.1 hypothetical protein [Cohnella sp. CFH 77786]